MCAARASRFRDDECTRCGRYRELVASLPDTDEPALFTLPANIERSVQASARVVDHRDLRAKLRAGMCSARAAHAWPGT